VRVAAVTPDPAGILASFADAHHIRYPLLSDIGGKVIERFGLLNPNIPPNPRQAPGIPFPGQFLLSPDGVVQAKAFTGDLRHRVTGSALVLEQLGDTTREPDATIEAGVVHAAVTLSTTRLFGGQEAALVVDMQIAHGWHVYGSGAPEPYLPLAIELDAERTLLATQSFTLPEPSWITFGATGERLPVHDGALRFTGRARLRWSPPPSLFAGLEDAVARRAIAPGRYDLSCTLTFQACDETQCLPPHREPFTLTITVEPHAAPAPPSA
jgi:hypothetical protein